MKIRLSKVFTQTFVSAALVMLSVNVSAATFEGKINGHGCAHKGTSCPVDRLDPHLTLEQDFVLQAGEGEYFFLPNLGRDTKVRYVLQDVQVTGEKDPRYNSIEVQEFRVKKGGSWKTVWSPQLQASEWQQIQTMGNQ